MANLTETAQWEEGIYRIETTDPVIGGEDGIDNRQAKQLGNRTLYLKDIIENAQPSGSNMNALIVGGTYFATETVANLPNDVQPFSVSVIRNGNNISQTAIEIGGVLFCTRSSQNEGATWTPWAYYVTNDALVSQVGQVFNPTPFAGNLNALVTSKTYIVSSSATNRPNSQDAVISGLSGFLEVRASGTEVMQTYTSRTVTGKTRVWVRTSSNTGTSWNAWTLQVGADAIVGQVVAFAIGAAPPGWLVCDGSAVSRTTYADLFAAISTNFGTGNGTTTFNLPDLRGEFIRGFDSGRGVDAGRGFGTFQSDQLGTHNHGIKGQQVERGTGTLVTVLDSSQPVITYTDNAGGNETRPRNVALLYCIKY